MLKIPWLEKSCHDQSSDDILKGRLETFLPKSKPIVPQLMWDSLLVRNEKKILLNGCFKIKNNLENLLNIWGVSLIGEGSQIFMNEQWVTPFWDWSDSSICSTMEFLL